MPSTLARPPELRRCWPRPTARRSRRSTSSPSRSGPRWSSRRLPTIASVEELKGKKIAATKGTDPYFFLLRSLREAGLTAADVEIVNLQHADGKVALERGQVDAWAGLDPHMAQTRAGAGLEADLPQHRLQYLRLSERPRPSLSSSIRTYDRDVHRCLRAGAGLDPGEPGRGGADSGRGSEASRSKSPSGSCSSAPCSRSARCPGDEHAEVLRAVIPILSTRIKSAADTDVEAVIGELLSPEIAQAVVDAAGE